VEQEEVVVAEVEAEDCEVRRLREGRWKMNGVVRRRG
jgi:hypothetical protein